MRKRNLRPTSSSPGAEAEGRGKGARGPGGGAQAGAWSLFWAIAKINTLTLGGGYVIVPVTASVFHKKGWMEEKEFYDVFARAQAIPGPLALNTSVLAALRLRGFRGALAAAAGVIVPPFLAIILVSGLLTRYGSLPAVQRFLDGAGAVVPGIVAAMIWKTASRRSWTMRKIVETVLLTGALIAFPGSSLPILLAGIAVFYLLEILCTRSN